MNTALNAMEPESEPPGAVTTPPPAVEFTLKAGDWLRCDPVYRTKLEGFRLVLWSGFSSLIALGLVFEFMPNRAGLATKLLLPLMVFGALGLLLFFAVVMGIASRAKGESLRAAAQRKVLGTWKATVTEEGVTFVSPTGERRLLWTELSEVHDMNTIVAFFGPGAATEDGSAAPSLRDRFVGALPRTAFASREARKAFTDFTLARLVDAKTPVRSFE